MRLVGNIIWFVLGRIPLGLANFKLITVSLRPFGREIVSVDEARRRGLAPQVTF